MIARISFVLLAVLAPLAVAGPTAWFSSNDECTSTAFDEDNTVHKMDKVGANCLVLEPDRKAISVSGAKSWSGDDKPYCVYLSEGGYCDGETIAMDIQGKNFCYVYQANGEPYKSYRIVQDSCWAEAKKHVPQCIRTLDQSNENYGCVTQQQTVAGVQNL